VGQPAPYQQVGVSAHRGRGLGRPNASHKATKPQRFPEGREIDIIARGSRRPHGGKLSFHPLEVHIASTRPVLSVGVASIAVQSSLLGRPGSVRLRSFEASWLSVRSSGAPCARGIVRGRTTLHSTPCPSIKDPHSSCCGRSAHRHAPLPHNGVLRHRPLRLMSSHSALPSPPAPSGFPFSCAPATDSYPPDLPR
jgi:hypothetical protein